MLLRLVIGHILVGIERMLYVSHRLVILLPTRTDVSSKSSGLGGVAMYADITGWEHTVTNLDVGDSALVLASNSIMSRHLYC